MGGTDAFANIVKLTPEEHFVAHQLLVKIYPGNASLAHAANLMANRSKRNKIYGWLRKRHAAATAEAMRGNQHTKGYIFSAEQLAKRSAALRGKKLSPNVLAKRFGRKIKISEEARARKSALLSALHKGKTISAEQRTKLSIFFRGRVPWNKGKTHSLETRAKMSAAHTGKALSIQTKAKISASRTGRKMPPRTEQWTANHIAAMLGRKHSIEARAKMSAAAKARWARAS